MNRQKLIIETYESQTKTNRCQTCWRTSGGQPCSQLALRREFSVMDHCSLVRSTTSLRASVSRRLGKQSAGVLSSHFPAIMGAVGDLGPRRYSFVRRDGRARFSRALSGCRSSAWLQPGHSLALLVSVFPWRTPVACIETNASPRLRL